MNANEFSEQASRLLRSVEFRQLDNLLKPGSSNLWSILDISRKEVLVSRFLAWLLDANIGHDVGDVFLKEFLFQVIGLEDWTKFSEQPTPAEILTADFSQLDVKIEKTFRSNRYDIVLVAKQCVLKKGFVCIIENKVGSTEGKEQTTHYFKSSLEKYPVDLFPYRLYIYLAPEEIQPTDDHFIPISYQLILDVIKQVRDIKSLSQRNSFLLDQFEESIMKDIAPDKNMVDLAQAIYDQYQDVFRFIYKNIDIDEIDPVNVTSWDGKTWFFNIGENRQGTGYNWEDSYQYSFICAGGAKRYRSIMEKFEPGQIIYAYVSGSGYVGVGEILKKADPFGKAILADGQTIIQIKSSLKGIYNPSDDDDVCDWVTPVKWEIKVPKIKAVKEIPVTRQTACRVYDDRKPTIEAIHSALRNKQSE